MSAHKLRQTESFDSLQSPVDSLLQANVQKQADEKSPSLETAQEKRSGDSMALRCYRQEKGAWRLFEFRKDQTIIKIGSDTTLCDISMQDKKLDPVHVVMKLVGNRWYIMERAVKDCMTFNGIEKKQCILESHSSCLIELNDTALVVTTVPEEANLNPLTEKTSDKTFTIKMKNSVKTFSFTKPLLIGNERICGLNPPGSPDFGAVIFSFSDKLYVYSLFEKLVHVNGKFASSPLPLTNGNVISVGETNLTLIVADEDESLVGFNTIPSFSTPSLCLLQLDDNGLEGDRFIMPDSGKSLFIGRGNENHFILNSKNTSRKHAQIVVYDNHLLILDCYSTNGTFINQQRVSKKIANPGDIVNFGDLSYLLCYAD